MKKSLSFVLLAFLAATALAQSTPFLPQATANVVVSASAQTLTLPRIQNPGPLWQYVVRNTASPSSGCTQPAFFTADGTTTATVGNGMPIGPNEAFLISAPAAITSWSVIAADVGCTFYVTVGVGQ